MKTQLLVVIMILAFVSVAQSAYCGRVLSETLVKYCQSGKSDMGKRSDSLMRTQLFGEGYWLTPQRAMGMGRGKRQEGIATECCEKSCSLKELLAYCPED